MKNRKIRPLPLALSGLLLASAYILRFHMYGYSFSALVCCCLAALILFYEITRVLLPRFPRGMRWLRRIFTCCLILGILVVGVTEGIIIAASFGNPQEEVEYVVILGAKVRTTGPSASLWDRIYAAADYLAAHPNVIAIASGGQGEDEPMTEADSIQDELVALGIDPSRVWVEGKATSTWENLHFALDLIEEKTGQRPEKLGVLSSEYHLFRASLFAKECGVEFVGIPARTSRVSQMVNHFMREVAGVWHYLLLGGQYQAA